MPRTLAVALLLATGMIGTGCGLFAAVSEPDEDVHVVSLTMDDCRYALAETRSGGFVVVAAEAPLVPGDILVGSIRTGAATVDRLAFPSEDDFETAELDVLAAGLAMTEARQAWRTGCGTPSPPNL